MGEFHTGPKYPLSDADPESYFDVHVIPPLILTKGERDCGYLAQYNQAYSRWVRLINLVHPSIYEKGTPIINPQAAEAHQSWLVTQLGDENSNFKPIAIGP